MKKLKSEPLKTEAEFVYEPLPQRDEIDPIDMVKTFLVRLATSTDGSSADLPVIV
jgi:hypothetical protein